MSKSVSSGRALLLADAEPRGLLPVELLDRWRLGVASPGRSPAAGAGTQFIECLDGVDALLERRSSTKTRSANGTRVKPGVVDAEY